MKKTITQLSIKVRLICLFSLFGITIVNAQVPCSYIAPTSNGSTTQVRAPNGLETQKFMRASTNILTSELAGIPNNSSISSFGFVLTGGTDIPVNGNLKVYMLNNTSTTYDRGTNWSSIISGMTLVYDGNYTIPTSAGNVDLQLTTPFTYTGGSIYIAYDYEGIAPFANVSATYAANSSIPSSLVSFSSTASAPTTLGSSSFRPTYRFVIGSCPSITTSNSTSLTSFTTCAGIASSQQSFTVSGSNLTNNIVITPPTGFEVSTTSGSGFASSVTLTQSGGSVTSTTVYIRLTAAASGTPSGDITCTSTGATTQNVAVTGTVNALPTASISVAETSGTTNNDGTICAGTSATLTATGGTSYLWSTSATTASITPSPSATTTYTVTVTNANGCTATANQILTVTALPTPSISVTETSGTTNNDGVICTGANATLTATGGTTYTWSTSATTAAITPSPASTTTYTLTATTSGCQGFANRSITVNGLPTAAIAIAETSGTANDGSICANFSTTLTASGGTTYAWSTSETTAAITKNPATTTTYTVTVTNANGCTATATQTLTVVTSPTASISVVETSGTTNNDGTICAGTSATLTTTGGTSYLWSTSATTASITPSPSATTTYTVTVTNANGCTATSNQILTVTALPTPSISVTETSGTTNNDGVICTGANATLTATGGTTYTWSTSATTAAITPSPASTTTYTLTATTSGCQGFANRSITVNGLPTAAIAIAETSGTANDGSICANFSTILTASGGTSYAWSTSETTAAITKSPATTTTYTVTVTNANGCSDSETQTLTVVTSPTASISVVETSGTTNNDGTICAGTSATLTATGGTSYLWSTSATTASITPSPSTTITYTVTVTNANGCSATANQILTVTALPTPSISVTETSGTTNNDGVICTGANATLTATGGTTYVWSTSATTAAITPSPASTTTYTLTATTSGCQGFANRSITVNGLPTAAIAIAETSGTANDGSICANFSTTLTASGGTSYAWSTSETTAAITKSPASTTTYTVTVTNANGCSATSSQTLTVVISPTASISVAETSGTTNNDGTICAGTSATLTATGGTTYLWSTSATTASITPSPSATTTYTVTVTNANGCTATANQILTVTALPTPSISVTETSGTTNNDGVICTGANATLTATGGTTYTWSTSATTAAITPSPASTTTYTLTATTSGCQGFANRSITVNSLPTAAIAIAENSGLQANDGTICTADFVDLTASGGVSYVWNTTETTETISVNPSSLTNYSATVTDANGCSDSETQTISVSALPSPSSQAFTICFGDSLIVGSNTYTSTGVYTDTFTGINGCDSVVTTTLTVNQEITTQQVFTICDGESISVGNSTYLIGGTYVDTLTAVNGCDSVVTTILTINPVFTTNNPIVVCFGESYTIGDSTYTTSGVYTNLFEAITGCDSTVTTNLTILPLNTYSQTINVCFGGSYSIGNNTYTSNGTYIDTLVSAFGCDSIVTTQINVYNQINTATTVNEITISATASGATYQWINCANNLVISGATSQSYTATANGEYAVIVTQNGCSDTSSCTTISTIGLDELEASFKLYPNPATSTLTIASSQTIDQIEITDLRGKVISIITEKGMNQTIDVSDLSRGMYLVKVSSQGNQITKQFVKE